MPRPHLPYDSGDMGKHIVILGGGTAGTMTVNRLRRTYGAGEYRITVVDQDDDHLYQPGLLFVPFGLGPAAPPRPVPSAVAERRRRLQAGADRAG